VSEKPVTSLPFAGHTQSMSSSASALVGPDGAAEGAAGAAAGAAGGTVAGVAAVGARDGSALAITTGSTGAFAISRAIASE